MEHEHITQSYINKLKMQQELYAQMLELSHKEQEILCSKQPRLGKVIGFLSSKQSILSKIGIIENELIALRETVKDDVADERVQSDIALLHKSISHLLSELLRIDSENESLLQQQLHAPKPVINSKRAIHAYQSSGK